MVLTIECKNKNQSRDGKHIHHNTFSAIKPITAKQRFNPLLQVTAELSSALTSNTVVCSLHTMYTFPNSTTFFLFTTIFKIFLRKCDIYIRINSRSSYPNKFLSHTINFCTLEQSIHTHSISEP